MTLRRDEATRHVHAPPERIFDLLCQPETHVAIDSTGFLHSADGKKVEAIGDQFVLRADPRAPSTASGLGNYAITVVITQYAPSVALSWTMRAFGREATGHFWGYLLEAEPGGTYLTAYYDGTRAVEMNEVNALVPLDPASSLAPTLSLLAREAER